MAMNGSTIAKPADTTMRAAARYQFRRSSARNSAITDTVKRRQHRADGVSFRTVIVELKKEYRFEAAHHLPRVPEGHKCRRVHGHSYKIELHVRGPVDPQSGWLIDFGVLDEIFEAEIFRKVDHRNLNDVPGLENSTCE